MPQKPILIIQNHPVESAGTILDWLTERALGYTVVHTYRHQALPAHDDIEAAICLGCPHTAVKYYELDYLKNLHTWLTRLVRENRPCLGLCFGAQIMAAILGARVEQNKAHEIGTYTAKLTDDGKSDPIFDGFPDEFPVFHWHHDTFRTPFGGAHLASTKAWKHQAYRKDRQVGLQFHLEARLNDVPKWCDTYATELTDANLIKEKIVADFTDVADTLRTLNYRLLDNWLGE